MSDKELLMLLLQGAGKYFSVWSDGGVVFEIERADEIFDLVIEGIDLAEDHDFSILVHAYKDRVSFSARLFSDTQAERWLSYPWEEFDFQKFATEGIESLVRHEYQVQQEKSA